MKQASGMTLIELLIVVVILGVISAGFVTPLSAGLDLWNTIRLREEQVAPAMIGMERMVREIRWVKDDRSVVTATASQLTFTSGLDDVPTTIEYQDGQDLLVMYYNNPEDYNDGSPPLVENVTSCTFTYLKMDGTAAAPIVGAAEPTDIWSIRAAFTVGTGADSVSLQETIHPRSFLRSNK